MRYILLFFLTSLCVQAQAPRGFYITAGANATTLNSDDVLSKSGTGYIAGLNFNMGYHESYNYQFEIMYNKGSVDLLTVDENFNPSANKKFDITSVEIGCYFNYYLLKPEEDTFFLGLQIGPNASFSSERSFSSNNSEFYLPYLIDEVGLSQTSRFNYGGGVGLTGGYNDLRFDLRYTHGFSNYLKDVKTNSYDEFNNYTGPALEGKVSSISFSISYRLNKLFGGE